MRKATNSSIKNRRLYYCWSGMKQRCRSAKRKDSKYYYYKKIGYCDEWESFENFQEWALNNGYADNLTLDRIDGDKSYSPSNCRWITIQEQQRNRSFCLYFTYEGETKTLAEWARVFGVDRTTLHDRIFVFGYPFEEAIKSHIMKRGSKPIKYNDKIYTQSEFVKMFKTSHQRVNNLRNKGYSVDQIVEELTNNYKPKKLNCKHNHNLKQGEI